MQIINGESICSNCNELLTEENYDGWFEIQLDQFGIETKVPVCNECILSDDGLERSGAY